TIKCMDDIVHHTKENRMKKNISIFLCLFLCAAMLFAYDNQQKIYETTSEVYEAIRLLYIAKGHALPSSTGPWSASELALMADKINEQGLSSGQKSTYEFIMAELGSEPVQLAEGVAMNFDFNANLEGYYHNSKDTAFQGRSNWIYGMMHQKPFIALDWETWAAGHFYGFFEFDLMNQIHVNSGEIGSTAFSTNIMGFQNLVFKINDMNFNFPYRAFISGGGAHWSFQIGRDRLNWGAGETGNLFVGDNLLYHNMARITTFSDVFKYTFVASFFPHQMNYSGTPWGESKNQHQVIKGLSMFMAHRIEGRLFHDKLNITLTESIMYMNEDGNLDLMVLNPMMFYHNNYIRSMSNSLLGFEVDWTIVNGLNIYAQAVIDEFALPGEPIPGKDSKSLPSAYGFLVGLKGAFSVGNGMLYGSLEGVRTDPFLYLRDKANYSQSKGEYGINYVVAVRNYSESGVTYDEEFLGYKYGGDALVGNFNVGYKQFGKFHVEGNVFFMAHGTFDKWTCWSYVGNGDGAYFDNSELQTPTESHPTPNHKGDVSARNSVEYTTVIGINGGFDFSRLFSAMLQADYIAIKNFRNIKDARNNDFQLVVGLSYSI
ncbi:MAG: hypothetical protein SO135_00390, partial [Sphaerochaetaceae bacterium]|nr:hypothetical protein [Sphaerochaetaceae bacterium]